MNTNTQKVEKVEKVEKVDQIRAKRFISYEEFLSLYPHYDGFNADLISRTITKQLLKICHCEDIIETEGNNSTDLIMINPNGEKVAVEIKDRSWGGKTSKMFGDHLIEKTKLQSLYNRKQNGEFDRLFLVSLFIDGVIVLTKDLENNILRQGIMKMPRTSTLDNHDLIDKECIFYNQDIKLYFYFEKDRINQNKYSVIFSNDPVDLFKLNNKYNIDKDGQMKLELF